MGHKIDSFKLWKTKNGRSSIFKIKQKSDKEFRENIGFIESVQWGIVHKNLAEKFWHGGPPTAFPKSKFLS